MLSTPGVTAQSLGHTVDLSGDTVLATAPGVDLDEGDEGAAQFFTLTDINGADTCDEATFIGQGMWHGCTWFAMDDGATQCGDSNSAGDVWYRWVAPCNGNLDLAALGSQLEPITMSVHSSCLLPGWSTLACDTSAGGLDPAEIMLPVQDGETYFIRFAGQGTTQLDFVFWVEYVCQQCVADISPPGSGDGTIGAADLAALLASWGSCAGCPADFNDDDTVGPADLAQLLAGWGSCR
jgi:hypothetical protein